MKKIVGIFVMTLLIGSSICVSGLTEKNGYITNEFEEEKSIYLKDRAINNIENLEKINVKSISKYWDKYSINSNSVDGGSIQISGPPDKEICICSCTDDQYIDVGEFGKIITVKVDYIFSDIGGSADHVFAKIEFDGTLITDKADTGTSESGTLRISKFFVSGENTAVKLSGWYLDWWNWPNEEEKCRCSCYFTIYPIHIHGPPNTPERPSGETDGYEDRTYSYSSKTTDPDGDKIFYNFNWGDGHESRWKGPYSSGNTVRQSHSYSDPGIYHITVTAKDTNGEISEPSPSLTVVMKKTRKLILHRFVVFRLCT